MFEQETLFQPSTASGPTSQMSEPSEPDEEIDEAAFSETVQSEELIEKTIETPTVTKDNLPHFSLQSLCFCGALCVCVFFSMLV